MKTVTLASGERVPGLGLGTWRMGVGDPDEAQQLRAIQVGIERGMTLIDTAEMYGEGRSESLVGRAIAGQRDKVFLVSKVLPGNASRKGAVVACEASLKRLGTDVIDLYLLHWRGSYPLAETFEAFAKLQVDGKIRHYGVSNFDVADMREMQRLNPSPVCTANQVMYNASDRGIEFDLYPRCLEDEIAVMAYCPLGEGRLIRHPVLTQIARRHNVTAAAIALAFTLRLPGVISIPKSVHEQRVIDNATAADLVLTEQDLLEIDQAFPPPRSKQPLAIT
jgi:diketogulonate reductase-like aldo/keto reductase